MKRLNFVEACSGDCKVLVIFDGTFSSDFF
jgi:hypothetical protein